MTKLRFNFTNYFCESVSTRYVNWCVANEQYNNSDNLIKVNFGFQLIPSRASAQAEVLAEQLDEYAIDNRRVVGPKGQDFTKLVYEAYIYSLFKGFIYGCYFHRAPNDASNTAIYYGHAMLAQMLAKDTFMIKSFNDVSVAFRLELTEENIKKNIKLFNDNFPFLQINSKLTKLFGTAQKLNYNISKYEKILISIRDLSKSGRYGELTQDSRDIDHDAFFEHKTGGFEVAIVDFRPSLIQSSMSAPNFSFGNAYYSDNGRKVHYVHSVSTDIKSHSFAFPRAVFMVLDDINFTDSDCYFAVDVSNDGNWMAKYEAYAITGKRIKEEPIQHNKNIFVDWNSVEEWVLPTP